MEICSEKITAIESILHENNLKNYKIFPDIQGGPPMLLIDLPI